MSAQSLDEPGSARPAGGEREKKDASVKMEREKREERREEGGREREGGKTYLVWWGFMGRSDWWWGQYLFL